MAHVGHRHPEHDDSPARLGRAAAPGASPGGARAAPACSGPGAAAGDEQEGAGSIPRSTETARIAPAMSSSTTRSTPNAACVTDSPSGSATSRCQRRFGAASAGKRLAAAEQRLRQVAEHEVGVGHGRVHAAVAVGGRAGRRAGRVEARRAAPRPSRPMPSEPPPEPIEWRSTPGTPIGWWSISSPRASGTRPRCISVTKSKQVPPMSIVITSRASACATRRGSVAGRDRRRGGPRVGQRDRRPSRHARRSRSRR